VLWIGLLSGTSADAADAALVRIGESLRDLTLIAFCSLGFPESLRKRINGVLQAPVDLRDLAKLDVELALPGHRTAIEDCRGRIAELKEHHRRRLAEVMAILADRSATAYEVASKMTWDIVAKSWQDFPVVQKWFAVSEAAAHLYYLERREKIVVEERDGLLMCSAA